MAHYNAAMSTLKWTRPVARVAIAAAACIGSLAIADLTESSAQGAQAKVGSVAKLLAEASADPAAPITTAPFATGEDCSINLLSVKGIVPAHYHAKHEETVLIEFGSGTMRLGDKKVRVAAGDLMHIPKGVVHGFVPDSGGVRVVSIFAPAFDGKDRVLVPPGALTGK